MTAGSICFIGCMVGLIALASDGPSGWIIFPTILALALNWFLFRTFRIKSYRRKQAEIYAENERDFRRSREIRQILAGLADTRSTEFSVVESALPGEWRPFRVERAISQSLRGEIVGDFQVNYWLGGGVSVASCRGNRFRT